jgi:UDPglucose 6-dehydrogenase
MNFLFGVRALNITIYGAGYVGLVTAACLAEQGNSVLSVDINLEKIQQLKEGHIPIYEPGLDALMKKNVEAGRLSFSSNMDDAVAHGELQFIAVNTPTGEQGADISAVLAVAKTIGRKMSGYRLVINKSTAPPETVYKINETIQAELALRQVDLKFDVASNPEFLKEGSAIYDFLQPDRIIVGANTEQARKLLKQLYQQYVEDNKVICMDVISAELTKYAANAMLATRISFMNEMAKFADHFGADIESIRQGMGADPRIGPYFLSSGSGYGGSCFPKDTRALIYGAKQHGFRAAILEAVEVVNEDQKIILFKKLCDYFKGDLKNKTIAVWGLAFKPNTDDIRDAPSRATMEKLWEAGAQVQAYDPIAMPDIEAAYPNQKGLMLCKTKEDCLAHADALLILTEWNEFKTADLETIKKKLKTPLLLDGRNIFEPGLAKEKGLIYFGIGRNGHNK